MLALTREISSAINRCELTHVAREPVDLPAARTQHREYERALEALGCTVRRLAADDTMPDSVFIEDTAVVLAEVAIMSRPGAASRRHEVDGVAAALGRLRSLVRIEPPGTLDGGDVLVVGRSIFVGRSSRTNAAGIEQFQGAVAPLGYSVRLLTPSNCLHLKSAATALDERTVLVNPRWISREYFNDLDCLTIDGSEPGAANVVSVHGRLIAAAAYPKTCRRLRDRGFDVQQVDASELSKAEGALTCCSLLVP
jgi:dimethylargininase